MEVAPTPNENNKETPNTDSTMKEPKKRIVKVNTQQHEPQI